MPLLETIQMNKDFWFWHEEKSWIDEHKERPLFFHEREVWFCALGINIGHEQNGVAKKFLRPMVVIKKLNRKSCLAIPLTTKIKDRQYKKELQTVDCLKSFMVPLWL